MNTVTGIPEAAWYFARLETASPSPPVRAYGDSSAARWITGAGEPSGLTSGAEGDEDTGESGAVTSVRRVRLLRRELSARGLAGAGGGVSAGEFTESLAGADSDGGR